MDKYNTIIFEKDLYIHQPNNIGYREVGETVSIAGNEFIIIHKGRPNSSAYDETCDGVWLMRKAVLGARPFDVDGNPSYEGSDLDKYLNDTFIPLFGTAASNFKTINLPVAGGTIARKGFCLSAEEFGLNSASQTLDYFKKDRNNIVRSWTRTRYMGSSVSAYLVEDLSEEKNFIGQDSTDSFPVYLCIVVPFNYMLGGALISSPVAKGTDIAAINNKLSRYICENEDSVPYASYETDIVRRRFPDEEGSPVYGFAQVIISGYISIPTIGNEERNQYNQMYFCNDITRQLQGIPKGDNSAFSINGMTSTLSSGNYSYPCFYNLYAAVHCHTDEVFGHHFNIAFGQTYSQLRSSEDNFQKVYTPDVSNIKVRTWLFREYQMI